MRLISLTANKKSFKPIKFNESGLSIIIGKQKDPEQSDSGKTYNGVGKSLVVALIHFCLGTNKNKNFETAIPGWEFTLKFKIKDEDFVSTRSTSEQSKIFLNGEEMGVKKFCETLKIKLFDIHEPVPFLKFRPLIKRFIRPGKDSYISFDSADSEEQKKPYQKLICNTFLLGIETTMITEKYNLHDSRLFAHMDPRQRASLFKIAYEQTNNDKGQYIASVNEDQVLSMKEQFTGEEFEKIITDNIVLELTDDSPESKLLGVQVNGVLMN